MGGENHEIEIADFPRLGKRMIKNREKIDIYEVADAKPFGPLGPGLQIQGLQRIRLNSDDLPRVNQTSAMLN